MGCISCGSQTPGQHESGCRSDDGFGPYAPAGPSRPVNIPARWAATPPPLKTDPAREKIDWNARPSLKPAVRQAFEALFEKYVDDWEDIPLTEVFRAGWEARGRHEARKRGR